MKKIKFNIFDILILCSVILIIFTSILRMINISKMPDIINDRKVTYTFVIHNEDEMYKDLIKQGDNVYLYPENILCGTVLDIEYNYVDEIVIYPDDSAKSQQNISKINIYLTIETYADMTENGFYISDHTFLFQGNVFDINTKNVVFNGEITEIIFF